MFAASTSDIINISLLLPIFIMCSIMGEFSYECAKCGGHDQFDWESECVVKIGHGEDAIYLKGEYSGYGYVDAFVVTDGDKFVKFQTECISKGISLLEGYSKRKVTKYPKGFQMMLVDLLFMYILNSSNNIIMCGMVEIKDMKPTSSLDVFLPVTSIAVVT